MTNPRTLFDNVPEAYDRARPEYPAAAFDALFAYMQSERSGAVDVVEIGPGTGQATVALLARAAHVTAVEIGPRLAAFLRAKFAGDSRLRVLNAPFEDADLAPACADLVFAATSFQWVDPEIRLAKPHRLLRPGGVLATLSTMQVRSTADHGYFERTFEIYRRYRADDPRVESPAPEDATPPDYDELRASPLYRDVVLCRYRWDQTYDTARYLDLVRSYSNAQAMEPDAREALLADLRTVIDSEYDGRVTRPLVIVLVMAQRG